MSELLETIPAAMFIEMAKQALSGVDESIKEAVRRELSTADSLNGHEPMFVQGYLLGVATAYILGLFNIKERAQ